MQEPIKYIIQFSSLKDGVYEFQYKLDETFVSHFEMTEIEDVDLNLTIGMEKKPSLLSLTFDIIGKTTQPCDRCGDSFVLDISNNDQLFVKFSSEEDETVTDGILVLSTNDNNLDLTQFIYEFVSLSLPVKRLHPEGECNEKVITLLDKNNTKSVDPRWSSLKDLKL